MGFWRKIAGLAVRGVDEAECTECPAGLPGEDPAFSTAVTALGAKLAKADGLEAQRKLAMDALAFVQSPEAPQAMVDIATTETFPLKENVTWWLNSRRGNNWKEYGLTKLMRQHPREKFHRHRSHQRQPKPQHQFPSHRPAQRAGDPFAMKPRPRIGFAIDLNNRRRARPRPPVTKRTLPRSAA